MQNKEVLLNDLNWLTEKISSQVWTLNLGTLATTWSLLIAAGSNDKLRIGSNDAIPIMLLCVLAMVSELLQYLAGMQTLDRYCVALRVVDRQNLNMTNRRHSTLRVNGSSGLKSC
jgi:hypothetical protein